MISIDPCENFSAWADKSDFIPEYKRAMFEDILDFDPLSVLLGPPHKYIDDSYEPIPMDLEYGLNDLEIERSNDWDYTKLCLSPNKQGGLSLLDDFFHAKPTNSGPISCLVEKKRAPLSPDSGIDIDGLSTSFDECADVFGLLEQDKDADALCEHVKFTNGDALNKFINDVMTDKNVVNDELLEVNELLDIVNLSNIIESDYNQNLEIKTENDLSSNEDCGFECPGYDSINKDHWLNEETPDVIPKDNNLYSGLVLEQIQTEDISEQVLTEGITEEDQAEGISEEDQAECISEEDQAEGISIKDEVCDTKLFVLRYDSQTIQVEHSYSKIRVIQRVVEEDYDEPVKKRKRSEIDEDFCPYQKPKRKVGRPRTNFAKSSVQKTQKSRIQKPRAPPKRTIQAPKRIKPCSTVPFDRREQHNQAERERRDTLKKNLDIVEDMTPGHILQMTQLALQSEKTTKVDELENNENNFTVDVLKRLDELMKKEPVCYRPKYKKATRNSKMVVLLSSTYFIGSLEKELKIKENRLAQLKKQYEESLKRLHPPKVSNRRVRRNYY